MDAVDEIELNPSQAQEGRQQEFKQLQGLKNATSKTNSQVQKENPKRQLRRKTCWLGAGLQKKVWWKNICARSVASGAAGVKRRPLY